MATIQEQVREEEEMNSFRVMPVLDADGNIEPVSKKEEWVLTLTILYQIIINLDEIIDLLWYYAIKLLW